MGMERYSVSVLVADLTVPETYLALRIINQFSVDLRGLCETEEDNNVFKHDGNVDGDLKVTLAFLCFWSVFGVLAVGTGSLVAPVLLSLDDDDVGNGDRASNDEEVDKEDEAHELISACRGSVNQSRCKCM
jgi:hypothetical protein